MSRWAEKAYVDLMMGVVGRSLVATSQVDDEVRGELAGLPAGFTVQMMVVPRGPGFTTQVTDRHTLQLLPGFTGKPDLCVRFKHITHAFLVFSFQEGTARAFAHDRMYVDGDISSALRVVRCLSRMEVLILPKVIAQRAVKRYPKLAVGQKLKLAAHIYLRFLSNLAKGQ